MSGTDVKTAVPACAPPRPSPVLLPSLSLRVAGRSECGPVRANNEDRFLAVRLERTTTPIATNIGPEDLRFVPVQTCWALAVADGMGGHAAGEVASTLALSRALELSQQGSRWFVSIGDEEAKEIMARLESVLTSVDRAVTDHGSSGEYCAGMGTTLTAAAAAGDCLFVCHAGDSRAYLLRSRHLSRLTRDDTMAQELVDAGVMEPGDMKKHPASHVLTQVIGRGDADFELRLVRLQHGDRLLLTTDGLTDALSDPDLESLASSGDCHAACNALVDRALLSGATDNVTAIVADVDLASG